jgi:hypothetical protein
MKLLNQKLVVDALYPEVDTSEVSVGDVIFYADLTPCTPPYGIQLSNGEEPDLSGYYHGPALMQSGEFVQFQAVRVKDILDRDAGIRILNEILDILTNEMTGNAAARTTCGEKVNILIEALEKGYNK